MSSALYQYEGVLYPEFLKTGNAMQFIEPVAKHFCKGNGLDIGAGRWPFPGARPIDISKGESAYELPRERFEYIFSSHCLEHITNPVAALEHWKTRLLPGGVLLLYLPSRDMRYWQTTKNRKHLHEWEPAQMARMLTDLGFVDVIHSERDMAWSFCVIGYNGRAFTGAMQFLDMEADKKPPTPPVDGATPAINWYD